MRKKEINKVNEEKYYKANNVLAELANYKLSLIEIDNLNKYISALMLTSPKETRISSAYNTLEVYPSTKGKLTEEEKENLIMCIWSCIYVVFADGTRGIDNLESVEDVEYIRNKYYDDLFDFKYANEEQVELPGKFGYDETNPIQVNCIDAIYEYFSRLRTVDNKSISWDRVGSCDNYVFNGPTDVYEIVVNKGKLFNKKSKYNMYINMYNKKNSEIAPEGFILVDKDE